MPAMLETSQSLQGEGVPWKAVTALNNLDSHSRCATASFSHDGHFGQ